MRIEALFERFKEFRAVLSGELLSSVSEFFDGLFECDLGHRSDDTGEFVLERFDFGFGEEVGLLCRRRMRRGEVGVGECGCCGRREHFRR